MNYLSTVVNRLLAKKSGNACGRSCKSAICISAFIAVSLLFTFSAQANFEFSGNAAGGTVDINGDGAADGTWSMNITGTTAAIEHSFINNGIGYLYKETSSNWDLHSTFNITLNDPDITYQLTLLGDNGRNETFGARFNHYALSWIGGGGSPVVNDPPISRIENIVIGSNSLDFDQRLGATLIQIRSLNWSIELPVGANTYTIDGTGGMQHEGFAFGLVSYADIKVEKTVSAATVAEGDSGSFFIKITNTGTGGMSAATSIKLIDQLPSGLSYTGHSITAEGASLGGTYTESTGEWQVEKIKLGESVTLKIDFSADAGVSGQTLVNRIDPNSITMPHTDNNANNDALEASIRITDPVPELTLEKPAPVNADEDGSGSITLNDTLTYTITATNDSAVILNNVVVSDPLITPSSQTCVSVIPGTSCILTGTYVVSLADEKVGVVTNTASAIADELIDTVTQTQRMSVIAAPAFSCASTVYQVQSGVLKEIDSATGAYTSIGARVSPKYNATGYNVADNYIYGLQEVTESVIRIHADGTIVQLYDIGFIHNAGDVDDNNHLWVKKSVRKYIAVDLANGTTTALNLIGSVLDLSDFAYTAFAGGDFLFGARDSQIMIVNLDTGASQVKPVSDLPSGGFGAAWSDVNGRLWVFHNSDGKIFEINDPFGVAPTAILRVAGTPSNKNDGMSCRNAPFPLLGTPSIGIEKPAPINADEDGSGDITVGDTLTYTVITATNKGNVTLNNVVVSDPMITPSSKSCGAINPTEICALSGSYVVTQDDVDTGEIINTASVVTDEITVAETDSVTTKTAQDAIIDVVKTADLSGLSAIPKVGDVIHYNIVVTNAGDVSLNNIVISDGNADVGSIVYSVVDDADHDSDIDLLLSGESATVTAKHTITQADIAAGVVENQAIATGKAPDGSDISDTSDDGDDSDGNVIDDPTVVNIKTPELGLAKSALTPVLNTDGTFNIEYQLVVKNTGNVTLGSIQLTDQLNAASQFGSAFVPSTAVDATGGIVQAAQIVLTNSSGNSISPSLNAVFNGGSNANLLAGDDGELAPGDGFTVNFSVRIDPNAANAPIVFKNLAMVSGQDTDDNTVSDQSNNGSNPEVDSGEQTGVPTPITLPVAKSELGIAKKAGIPSLNADGTFDIDFILLIENTGNVVIDNLQLADHLNAANQLGSAYIPSSVSDTSSGVIVVPALTLTNTSGDSVVPSIDPIFDGGSNANLLVGTDGILAPGDLLEIIFVVRIDPNAVNAPIPLQNSATISGDDPADNSVSDVSDVGSDPQINPGETTGTPTPITPPTTESELGVAKQSSTLTLNADGTFDIDFTFLLQNTGNVVIDNLQLTDQLDATDQLGSAFAPSTAVITTSGVITAPSLTLINTSGDSVAPSFDIAFDGGSKANLFVGTDGKLAPADQIEITFSVRIDPNATNAPHSLKNSATVRGKDPADNSVSDASDNGVNPEVNPGENSGTPTPIIPPAIDPELGIAKQAGTPTLNDDGSFDIDFTLVVENTGNLVIENLQLSDQLNAADQLGNAYSPSTAAVAIGGIITAPNLTLVNVSGNSVLPSLNPNFDGGSRGDLLAGNDGSLAPGDQLTVTFNVRIDPNADNAPSLLQNSASVSGDDPSGTIISDKSDAGTDPATNPGENTGTPTLISPPVTEPQLGVAKQSGAPMLNSNGTFDIEFTLLLQNTGNVVINNLQLSDVLNAENQLGSAYIPSTALVTTGGVITAPSLTLINTSGNSVLPSLDVTFDGGSNANLLLGTDGELAPGDQLEMTFSVRIDPNAANAPRPLKNSAIVSGDDPANNRVSDVSDSGADPTSNPGENTGIPTLITPPSTEPELGVAKQVGASTLNDDGSFDIAFILLIENTGDVVLDNLQLADQLNAADQLGSTYIPSTVLDTSSGVIVAPTLTLTNTSGNSIAPSIDSSFDGGSNANLLLGTDGELAPGDQLEIIFSVHIDPNAPNALSPLQNSATVSGEDPSDSTVFDVSDSGSDPQTHAGEAIGTPTAVVPPATTPQLGVAKQAGTPTLNDDGSFDIDFTLLLQNTGNVVLDSLQLADQLNAADQLGSAFTPSAALDTSGGVIDAPVITLVNSSGNSVTPSIDPDFDGGSNANLFVGTDGELAPGDQIEVRFSVRIDPNAVNAPSQLKNSAIVSGDDPANNRVSDFSDSGTDPMANPGENTGIPTPITPPATEPELGVAKQAGTPTLNDDGSFDIAFTLIIENTGNVVIDNLQLADQLNVADQLGSAFIPSTASVTTGGVITAPILTLTNTSGNSVVPSLDATFDGGGNANLLVGTDGTLAPADQLSVTFTVHIDPNAPNPLQNSATASGKDPSDNTVSDQSDNGIDPESNSGESTGTPTPIIPPTISSSLEVTDVADVSGLSSVTQIGDVIEYTYTVTNTGNVTVTNIEVTDPNADSGSINNTSASDGGIIDQLAPGEFVIWTSQHTITQADIDAALVISQAMASGNDPASNEVSDQSDNGVDTDGNVLNDPTLTPLTIATSAQLSVVKNSAKLNVRRGEIIPYTIQIENLESYAVSDITIVDRLPAGFKYVKKSATLDAIDVSDACTQFTVGGELRCEGVDFEPKQKHNLNLLLVSGAGVSEGKYINQAWAEGSALAQGVSNTGQAAVYITPDPLFDCSDVIGKVYDDKNYDGYQNKGEEVLPNVRLATARGLLVTTDEYGRYHISCAAVPNQDRGSNFIIKVDERSLPSGYRITTENPRVVRLTRGKIEEADFGAAIHRVVRLDVNSSIYKPESSGLADGYESHLNELLAQLVNAPSVLRIGYVSQHESKRLVKQRIKSLRKAILNKWQQQGCCYRLLVEHEITQTPLKK